MIEMVVLQKLAGVYCTSIAFVYSSRLTLALAIAATVGKNNRKSTFNLFDRSTCNLLIL
jgi:hypothetical protein